MIFLKKLKNIIPAQNLTTDPFTSSIYYGTQVRTSGFGDKSFWGNFDADIPNRFFNFLEPYFGDELKVIEGFMGSGTTSDLCLARNIPFSGCDLRPAPRQERVGEHWEKDILEFVPDFEANAIVCHDPYYNMVPYSEKVWDKVGDKRDISLSKRSYAEFLELINQAHTNLWNYLLPGGYFLIMTGIVRKNGIVKVLADDMIKFGTQIARIIKVQNNARSQIKLANGGYSGNFISTDHEEILICRKEDRFLVFLNAPKLISFDVRNGTKMSWAFIAKESIKELKKTCCSMSEIYEAASKLFPRKCSESHCKTWKNSLRRSIYESRLFTSIERNNWTLAA